MLPINPSSIFLVLLIIFEIARGEGTNNKIYHSSRHTKRSAYNYFNYNTYKYGNKLVGIGVDYYLDSWNFSGKKTRWTTDCGCRNGTEIITQNYYPINCACIMEGYDKEWAPGGGGDGITTVLTTLDGIKVLNVNEMDNTISIDIAASYIWEDSRIGTTFLNNETKIHLTNTSPNDESFAIWTPSREHNGVTASEEWNFSFLGSLVGEYDMVVANYSGKPDDAAIVQSKYSGKWTIPCNFNFTNFPFDSNRCNVRVTSKLSGPLREVLYQNKIKMFEREVGSLFNVYVTPFGNPIDNNNITNDFGFDLSIKREITSYLFQYYIPCSCIVVISSISFIIPLTAIPGRVGLMVTLFLTLANLMIHQEVRTKVKNIKNS